MRNAFWIGLESFLDWDWIGKGREGKTMVGWKVGTIGERRKEKTVVLKEEAKDFRGRIETGSKFRGEGGKHPCWSSR